MNELQSPVFRRLPCQGLAAVLFVATCWSDLLAQNASPKQINNRPSTEVVLIISKQLFDDLTQDSIDLSMPVDETLEGTRFTGEGNAVAKSSIQIQNDSDNTAFEVQITAEAQTSLHIESGPASADAVTTSQVSAKRVLVFDGAQFTTGEVEVGGNSATQFTRFCSRQSGVIGRVVRRVARKKLSENRGRINQAVDEAVEDFAREEVERLTSELTAELNQTTPLEETVQAAFPETKNWIYYVANTEDFVRVDAGPRKASLAKLPKARERASEIPMEVWIRLRPAEEMMASVLLKWNRSHDLLKQYLPEEQAAMLAEDVTYELVDKWLHIEVGLPAVGRVLGNEPTQK